jgi:hypothetical protein
MGTRIQDMGRKYKIRRKIIMTFRRRGEDTKIARKLANSARRTFHDAID